MRIYLVGGAVRDKLLGLPAKEHDWVVVGATPEQMEVEGYKRVDTTFPVFAHPETGEEYALARTESKTRPGHKGFDVYAGPDVTLEADLKRRDLTINAIAQADNGALVDPFDGQRDLNARLLKHVSPAFIEDPLRVLRIARFAARLAPYRFRVAKETFSLLTEMAHEGELSTLSPNRVWKELDLSLSEPDAVCFFDVLYRCGALATLIPELDHAIAQSCDDGSDGVQTVGGPLTVLRRAAKITPEPEIRFAALVQATANLSKNTQRANKHIAKALCERLRVPSRFRELALLVADHYPFIENAQSMNATSLLDGLEALDAFRRTERFEDFLTACNAFASNPSDRIAASITRVRTAFNAASSVDASSAVTKGLDGKQLGEELHRQRREAVARIIG